MTAPKKAKVLETVVITEDLPEYGIKAGEKAVVLEAFDTPEEAYLLEVVDESGTLSKTADWVRPNQLSAVKAYAKQYLDKGFELVSQGDLPAAEVAFRQAVTLYPKDIGNIGESIRRSFTPPKDLANARLVVRLYEMCFRLAPDHQVTRFNLAASYQHYGRHLASEGKIEEALGAFNQALLATTHSELLQGVSKSITAVYTNLAIKATEDNDLSIALDYFRAAFQVRQDETTRSNLAKAYFNLAEDCLSKNHFTESIGLFEEALLAGYIEPALFNDYAFALIRVGRMGDAISALEKGHALAPDSEIIEHNLQMARVAIDDFKRSKKPLHPQYRPEPIPTQEYQLAA